MPGDSERGQRDKMPVATRSGQDLPVVEQELPVVARLIVEVRSATAGVGSFTFKFDHMAELVGRTADQIVAARKSAA